MHKKFSFWPFYTKVLQNLGKTYLGHVPINRSHQMNNHFCHQVTTCEINTQISESMTFSYLMYQNNKKLKKS